MPASLHMICFTICVILNIKFTYTTNIPLRNSNRAHLVTLRNTPHNIHYSSWPVLVAHILAGAAPCNSAVAGNTVRLVLEDILVDRLDCTPVDKT